MEFVEIVAKNVGHYPHRSRGFGGVERIRGMESRNVRCYFSERDDPREPESKQLKNTMHI